MSVNGGLWHAPDAPFGGYKQSGIGRENAVAGLEEFLQTKVFAEPQAADPVPVGGDQMTKILQGVRILEVAEHTFVPAASAALADLGAEVIKIEHVTRGDAMRGIASTGVALVPTDVHALLEHSNRGKQSLGLDLTQPDGLDVLYKLAATCDVFLTNKLPTVRDKLRSTSTTFAPATRTSSTSAARARAPRARRRQGLLRLAGLLGTFRHRLRRQAGRTARCPDAAGTGVRRLDRRDHDRRCDHGCTLPP